MSAPSRIEPRTAEVAAAAAPVADGRAGAGRVGRALLPDDAATAPSRAAPAGRDAPDTPPRRGGVLDRLPGGRTAAGALVPLLLLALWQAVTAAQVFLPVQLPAPAAVWAAGVDLVERGELAGHLGISTQRVLIGFAVGSAAGLAVGALVGLSRTVGTLFAPTIGALRAVPSLAWVPLLILWLRIGESSKLTLIAIGAFFPVYTTVASALRHVDHQLVEVGRAYGLKGPQLLARVQLPAAIPSVVSGLRLALAQSWLFLVAAELIASSEGLGFLLIESQNNGRTDRLLLAIVLLAVLGKLTDAAIGLGERRLLRRWS